MKEEIYEIGGMHCAACSSAIERVTRKLPGVERSEVNLPMNRLTIVYDEGQVTPEMIIKKIEKAGFTAKQPMQHTSKEKETPEEETKVLKKQKLSLILSIILAGLVLVLSMGQMLWPQFPVPNIISITTHPFNFALIQLLLTIPVLILDKHFFVNGFKAAFHGNPNMDTLVALSATASVIYSVVMMFLITDNAHAVHNLYFESAAVVVALVSVGKYLEARNKEKTKGAITRLMKLAPDTAILVDSKGQREVPTSSIKLGDVVLVKSGARIPLDGKVIKGNGSVNEAMLTGESLPVEKREESDVIGGSVLADGLLYIQVTHIGEDTVLAKIIKFVEEAQGKKAPISKLADQIAGYFVPIVIGIAIVTSIIWLLSGADFAFVLKVFTSILVIACPCALGLATPTAIIVGTGLGASKGILIRSGEALEITHQVKVAVFDKTGTITKGELAVTHIIGEDQDALLRAVYGLEKLSDHPLSKAICEEAIKRKISVEEEIKNFKNKTGRGLYGELPNGKIIIVGNKEWMDENQIDRTLYNEQVQHLQSEGRTVVYVAEEGKLKGIIALSDTIKQDAKVAIENLRKMGIRTVLLTGDHKIAAEYIGGQVGVDEIVAQVLPTEKAEVIKKYQDKGYKVMMVGDGINDAPALAQADIGCAVGNGSDIAIDSAQVILMKNDLMDVYRAIRLSQLTIRNIKQNLFWAFCYNVLGIPIAAGILYPSFGILLSPMIGGLAMSLSSLFVITNALRLRGKKL